MTNSELQKFTGKWVLDVASCDFEQGDPPKYESHAISVDGDFLVIEMNRTGADGEIHNHIFRTPADGSRAPFAGGPLADEIGISAASASRLSVSAYHRNTELMVATRVLDPDGAVMHLVQRVQLPDGTAPENRSLFRRVQ